MSEWSLENMVLEETNLEEVCQLPKTQDVVFPERRSMIDSKLLCTKLGGNLTVVTDQTTQDQLISKFNSKLAGLYTIGVRQPQLIDNTKLEFVLLFQTNFGQAGMILSKRASLQILIQGKLCRRMGDSGPFTLGNLMENYWRIVQWYGPLEVPGMI